MANLNSPHSEKDDIVKDKELIKEMFDNFSSSRITYYNENKESQPNLLFKEILIEFIFSKDDCPIKFIVKDFKHTLYYSIVLFFLKFAGGKQSFKVLNIKLIEIYISQIIKYIDMITLPKLISD